MSACILLLSCWTSLASADTSGQHRDESWWRTRFSEKQQALQSGPVRLIFLGDSITHSFEWDADAPEWKHWYSGRDAVNLGFNGDTTEDVIWRVRHGELSHLSPKLVVILIGTNDIGKPVADIAAAIKTLVQEVKDRLPNSAVLVLGILPSGRPEYEQAAARDVNERLRAAYATPHAIARYQDVSCVFRYHGQFRADLFRESRLTGASYPLHPTPHGMDLLAAAIEPTVARTLGDHVRATLADTKGNDCPKADASGGLPAVVGNGGNGPARD